MDRHDLNLLRQCTTKYAHLKPRQEDRAADLYRAGYLERDMRVSRMTSKTAEHRWAYRLTEQGKAALAAQTEKA